nr:MAG: ORF1 [TTV-like mini virus]
MPFWNYRRRAWRRRPYRRWGFRKTIRKRFRRRQRRRRRHFTVRKKKLRFLHLKEWQPNRILKCAISGLLPLYMTTNNTISNNLRQYEDEIAPHWVPNGGGYSITAFTLAALYQQFQRGRCWWTNSNIDLPLIRFTGAKLTCFRSESSDYFVTTHNCYPMLPSMETYNSTHPTIMQLNRKHRTIKCKKHNTKGKPYKIIRVSPPAQLTNRWYFQKDLANEPLFLLFATGTSLDRWYMGSTSISTSTGFSGLNPSIFHFHNWQQQTTTGYHPKEQLYLFSYQQSTPKITNINQIVIQNIIYLGATGLNTPGQSIADYMKTHTQDWSTAWDGYFSQSGYWGNLFIPFYFSKQTGPLIYSAKHPKDLKLSYTQKTDTLKDTDFKFFTDPLYINYRYNPFPDDGIGNQIYLIDIKSLSNTWDPPPDKELHNDNLPLWLGFWGFIDFHKNNPGTHDIDSNKIIVFKTKHITPHTDVVIPIDQDFLLGRSPYRPDNIIIPADATHWYPKTYWQHKSINDICQTGPGTLKLPSNVSAEGHIKFKLYFKLGGCAIPIKQIKDPDTQPVFPTPNNMLQTTSLQSPETPIEHYLYSFDWRRQIITPSAAERITSNIQSEKPFVSTTGLNLFNIQRPPQQSPQTSDSETEEKEKETLQLLINKLHRKQQRFRQQILQLLTSQNIE